MSVAGVSRLGNNIRVAGHRLAGTNLQDVFFPVAENDNMMFSSKIEASIQLL